MVNNRPLGISFFLLGVGVIAGALGAHALKDAIPQESLDSYKTGAYYQQIHSLVLVLIGFFNQQIDKYLPWKKVWNLLCTGIILFSGSIYFLSTKSLTGLAVSFLGPITPLGGLCIISAYFWLGFAFFRSRRP